MIESACENDSVHSRAKTGFASTQGSWRRSRTFSVHASVNTLRKVSASLRVKSTKLLEVIDFAVHYAKLLRWRTYLLSAFCYALRALSLLLDISMYTNSDVIDGHCTHFCKVLLTSQKPGMNSKHMSTFWPEWT